MATGTVSSIAADNTSTATVNFKGVPTEFTVTVYPVTDGTTTFAAASTGTANLECLPAGSSQWETVYQSDGTTAVSFAVTASSPSSITIAGTALKGLRTSPTSLDSGKSLRIGVAYGE